MNENSMLTASVAVLTIAAAAAALLFLLSILRTDFETLADTLQFSCQPGSPYTTAECP